jgi:predicted ArsR family transcriptional regulator
VLRRLSEQSQPTTLAALAHLSRRHENTVREHLDALVRSGHVLRFPAEPDGRGRPAWLYEVSGAPAEGSGPHAEYAGLAAALAETLQATSDRPVELAVEAGERWGHELAARRGAEPQATARLARHKVVELVDDLGFGTESDSRATRVRLTRCPLLEAAHRYPEIVCAVHEGLARAAMMDYGADPDGVRLEPFSEPGACRLHLTGPRSSSRG